MLGDGLYCEGTSHSLGLCIELFSKLLWETWLFPLIHLQKSSKTESSGLTCPSFQWLPSCSSSFPSYISLHMNTGYMMIWKPFQSYLVTLRRLVGFTQQLKQSKDTWYRFYKEKKKKKDTSVLTCSGPGGPGHDCINLHPWVDQLWLQKHEKWAFTPQPQDTSSGRRYQFRRGCSWEFGNPRLSMVGSSVVWCWQDAYSCVVMMICEAVIPVVYWQGILLNAQQE